MMFNLNADTYSKTYACDFVSLEAQTGAGLSSFGWRYLSTGSMPSVETGNETVPAVRTEVYPDPSSTLGNP
jgi:hypothetical protein